MTRSLSVNLFHSDCLDTFKTLPDNSVDSIITDPPYGIRFMGESWDGVDIEERASYRAKMASHDPSCGPSGAHRSRAAEAGKYDLTPEGMLAFQEFSREWASEAKRVLKPGGHLLSFAAARTYHHMAVGIEMAGFEIRDQIMWVFGSGFPKSHNLDGDWKGWGTGLKPAHEPICIARKPFKGTVKSNVQAYGTGALNIDGCRVARPDGQAPSIGSSEWGGPSKKLTVTPGQEGKTVERSSPHGEGRWPANLIHDGSEDVIALFPAKAGAMAPVKGTEPTANGFSGVVKYGGMINRVSGTFYADSGSAARFFYCPKTSSKDRHEGLNNPGPQFAHGATLRDVENQTKFKRGNFHPTVKPTALMAYLCRLVTPPGGTVLDPFMGSGSTGKAAIKEGFNFIGVERERDYFEIARARINFALGEQGKQ